MMAAPIRVLVVDDSAYIRKVIREMLSRSQDLEVVGTARDGEDALRQVEELRPDVVTCDLIMPGMDGVEFIRRQMAIQPVPIVVVSIAPESSERVLMALDAGAVDFVQKPTALASERVLEIADELAGKLRVAAAAPVARFGQPAVVTAAPVAATFRNRYDVVVVGVSTGGPQGLRVVVPRLPADFPLPIAIVLHMPVGYTDAYARRLDELSAVSVREASDGERLMPGVAVIAPAGRHLVFDRDASGHVRTRLEMRPLDSLHRPSVDVLFQSAAAIYGDRVLALVMTGMGEDGRQGAAWIKAKGGTVLTEAEESCIVYGMPRAVVEAGLSDASVRLEQLAEAVMERV
jgi:two-component system chemotaxis response regulator CheB